MNMDEERMNRFKKEIQRQRSEEFCRNGHYFESSDKCQKCGIDMSEFFGVRIYGYRDI